MLSGSSAGSFNYKRVGCLGLDLHSNMPTTQVYQDFLASLSFLSLPRTSVSALPFPSLSQSTPAKVTVSSSDPLQLLLQLPLFPITASVNNPHLNEGTCIESPLWSGAAELCRSSQRCCSQWASRKNSFSAHRSHCATSSLLQ